MNKPIRPSSKKSALFLLSLMVVLGMFPLDVMLPSYPALANAFGMKINEVTLFVAMFAVGFSGSQILIGPLSDKYGRPIMLKIGLVISLMGVMGCLLSSTQTAFAIARVVQGAGCGCFVLAQAIVQDVFTVEDRQRIRIYLLSLSGICISFSPLLGTYLQYALDWQGSFYLFATLASILLGQIIFYFPNLQDLPLSARGEKLNIVARYADIITFRPFVCSWLTSAMAFSCHFGFIAVSPIIFLDTLQVSSLTYALVLLLYGGAYVVGGLVATRLAKTLVIDAQIKIGLATSGLSGLIMISMIQLQLSIATVAVPMIICTIGTTLIRPAAASRAMEMFSEKAGASSAAGGTIMFVTAGSVSVILSNAPLPPLESLSIFILIATTLGYALNKWGVPDGPVLADTQAGSSH
jgi:DHA1 family bicyclomycin/chloramphenicol resistance-like MFS transporter